MDGEDAVRPSGRLVHGRLDTHTLEYMCAFIYQSHSSFEPHWHQQKLHLNENLLWVSLGFNRCYGLIVFLSVMELNANVNTTKCCDIIRWTQCHNISLKLYRTNSESSILIY